MKKIFLIALMVAFSLNQTKAQVLRNFETGFDLGFNDAKYLTQGTGYWFGYSLYVIFTAGGYTLAKEIPGEVWNFYPGASTTGNNAINGVYIPACLDAVSNGDEVEYNQGKIAGASAYWNYIHTWQSTPEGYPIQ